MTNRKYIGRRHSNLPWVKSSTPTGTYIGQISTEKKAKPDEQQSYCGQCRQYLTAGERRLRFGYVAGVENLPRMITTHAHQCPPRKD